MLKKIEELEALERKKKRSISPWELTMGRKKDVKRESYVSSRKKMFFQKVLLTEPAVECLKGLKIEIFTWKMKSMSRPKKFKDEDLKTLLIENSSKTREEIAKVESGDIIGNGINEQN